MTKTELQTALAEATQTDKRTAGVFLETLSALAYKTIKKNGEFVMSRIVMLVMVTSSNKPPSTLSSANPLQ